MHAAVAHRGWPLWAPLHSYRGSSQPQKLIRIIMIYVDDPERVKVRVQLSSALEFLTGSWQANQPRKMLRWSVKNAQVIVWRLHPNEGCVTINVRSDQGIQLSSFECSYGPTTPHEWLMQLLNWLAHVRPRPAPISIPSPNGPIFCTA